MTIETIIKSSNMDNQTATSKVSESAEEKSNDPPIAVGTFRTVLPQVCTNQY